MSKFTIDFTISEKRKLWKAKVSLRRLEEYSLKDLLDAIKPDKEREREIRKQFFEYGSSDSLGIGLASIMGKNPLGLAFNNESAFGLSAGIKAALDTVNNNDKLYGKGLRGMLDIIDQSNSGWNRKIIGSTRMADMISGTLNSGVMTGRAMSALESSRSILDVIKPINERLNATSMALGAMDRLRKDTSPFAMNSLSGIAHDAGALGKITGSVSAIISQSLLQQETFKRFDIGSIARELSKNSTFERAHMSGIGAALAAATNYTSLAEKNLGTFAWDSLGERNKLSNTLIQAAQKNFLDVSAGYSVLLKNIADKPNWVYEAPETAKIPAQDYYIGSRILKIVSSEEEISVEADNGVDAENLDAISRYLPAIHADLPDLWRGALEALNSDNPDKIRHMITSIRELYNHVLHRLAPDDAMAGWDPSQTHYDKGRPTRRGRFMYICRNLEGSSSQFAKLLKAEIDATLVMIELFNGGTHTIKSNYAPHELQFIRIKAETTLRTFLSLEFEINRK